MAETSTIESEARRDSWTIFGPPIRNRRCGGCTLCCVLLPVKRLPWGPKPANLPCVKLCSRGCSIYARRPDDCRIFSCRWLMDETTAELRRPDKTGYVIDPMLDHLIVQPHDGSPPTTYDCIQIWNDPKRPDAHRDPALREWLALMADHYGLIALVRYDSEAGFVLVAPSVNAEGRWVEHRTDMTISEDAMRAFRGPMQFRVT